MSWVLAGMTKATLLLAAILEAATWAMLLRNAVSIVVSTTAAVGLT